MENNQSSYKTVINANRKAFKLNLRELYSYRDLIILLVKRDFVSKYKQTILGPLWAIIQPLLTSIVFTVIFGNLANLTTADSPGEIFIPGFLFYMSGNIIWSYFSGVVQATANTFIGNAALMGKVYFPRLAVPIATAISNLISMGIQLVLFFCIYLFCIFSGEMVLAISWTFLLLPLVILQSMLLSTGVGIIISSLTTKYRDLTFLVGFGLQLWQYATPIAYGLLLIPSKWMNLYLLNPVSEIVLIFRYALFGSGFFNLTWYIFGWLITLLIFLLGVCLFNKIEGTFMDTV